MPPDSPTDDKIVVGNASIDISNAALANTENETKPDANAESSTATDAKPQSALDIVKEALKAPTEQPKDNKSTSDTEASSANEEGSQEAEKPADTQATDEEADAKLPFHNHPRWKEVKAERDAYKEIATDFKSRADVFDRLSAATQESGMSGEEFDQGFEIMRLMKTNPIEAWQKLQPFVQQLQLLAGEHLPNDLQEKVDSGLIDAETAKEIAVLRTENLVGKNSEKLTAQQLEQQRNQENTAREEQANLQMGNSITAWENNWKKSDPDYLTKQPLVQARIVELMGLHGKPSTPEHAIILANHAKADIDKVIGKIIPAKTAMTTVTGGRANNNGTVAPKNSVEAVKLALEGKYLPATT